MSRRFLLLVSFVVAACMHALLLYFAPRITLLSSNAEAARVLHTIQVELRDASTTVEAPAETPASPTALLTRPGTVNDLIEVGEGEIIPDFLAEPLSAVASEPMPSPDAAAPAREFDLAREEDVQKRVDARILEISQADARRGLDVARRLVRPSSDRILAPDEFPTLRNTLGDASSEALAFDLPSLSLLSGSGDPSSDSSGLPARIEAAPMPDTHGTNGGAAAAEMTIARAPVERAAAQAKEESRFDFLDDMLSIELSTFTAPSEPQGYFQLRIVPRQDVALDVLRKEVVFVIDSSSSIASQKLRETVRGVQNALGQLREDDLFNVVAFSDTPSFFRQSSVTAVSSEIEQAREWLNSLGSRGETDIYKALQTVLAQAPQSRIPRVVVVFSDGRPTTGVKDGRAIINGLTEDNSLKNSVFAFSGGNTVNQPLLDLLAYRNKGAARVLSDIKGIDMKLPEFTALLRDPLLIDLDADFARIDEESLFPATLPDFYAGQVITIYGRYDSGSDEPFLVRLTGTAAKGEKEVVFRANLADAKQGTEEIARRWAFQKAYGIIEEISDRGEQPELLAELRSLSRKYGFRTSYDE